MNKPLNEESKLVARLLRGDERAFDQLIDDYYPRLYRFACSRLGSESEAAEDIVQATLIKVIENLGKYRGEASLFTWICSFCRFEIAAMWRRRYGRGRPAELVEDRPEVRAALESISMRPPSPDSELERRELGRLIRSILDHLPVHYARALEMKYVSLLSVEEIAARLEVSPKAAESLLTRARSAFKEGFVATTGREPTWS